jgi:FOG: FHA domain
MLVVLNSGRRMTLDTGEDILIGRKDNARGIFPDVDLGLDGGYDAGVSRRHAIISFQQGACVLQDLNSANGTFINATRIDPHVAFPLHDGDELTFGTLILRIEFH